MNYSILPSDVACEKNRYYVTILIRSYTRGLLFANLQGTGKLRMVVCVLCNTQNHAPGGQQPAKTCRSQIK